LKKTLPKKKERITTITMRANVSDKMIRCDENRYRRLQVENEKETIQDVLDRNDVMSTGEV
jgi:hypothetical protein